MSKLQLIQWSKNLQAAEGYLELGLLPQARLALDQIAEDSPFKAARLVLMGQIQARENDFASASRSFHQAAAALPGPVAKGLWSQVAQCFHSLGEPAYAKLAERNSQKVVVAAGSGCGANSAAARKNPNCRPTGGEKGQSLRGEN